MQQEFALITITHTAIAISILVLLVVLLVALRQEVNGHDPMHGTIYLGIAMIGLCAFMALMAAFFQARRIIVPETISRRLDTAFVSPLHGDGARRLTETA